MLGEMRDKETAETAIEAAQTGHLVLSTLHTPSALDAITRLQFLGISPYHIAHSVTLIIAQRLLRVLCPFCKTGCKKCKNGYQGRTGIYELLPITSTLRELILSHASPGKIKEQLTLHSFFSLHDAGIQKIKDGITNAIEMERILPSSLII
jgi:type IV pilus assembly protein PilB